MQIYQRVSENCTAGYSLFVRFPPPAWRRSAPDRIPAPSRWWSGHHWDKPTQTHGELTPGHDKRMSNSLWYANTVGPCTKTTEEEPSPMSSKTTTSTLPHTCRAIVKTIVRKCCTSGGYYCDRLCHWCMKAWKTLSFVMSLVVFQCLWYAPTSGSSWWVRWRGWWGSSCRCRWC